MKNVKKIRILWEDEEGNQFEKDYEVGDSEEFGESLISLWEIKKIKVIK